MALEYAKPFYDSAAWKKCRKAFIAIRVSSDGGICQDCHEQPGRIVHHVKEITPENINDPDITLNFRNLRYVCHDCHEKFEHERFVMRPGNITGKICYEFDEEGNPVGYTRTRRKRNGEETTV